MKKDKVDILIVGAGPAGIAAGIYACMDKTSFCLLDWDKPCTFLKESINSHRFVDGFTGVPKQTTGSDLQKSFISHYRRLCGKIAKERVISLRKNRKTFLAQTEKRAIIAQSVILACGCKPRKMTFKKNKRDRHIYFSCVEKGGKFIGRNVIVVGARNSGAVAACYLNDLGCKVSLLEAKNEIQAKDKYKTWLKERKNIKVYTESTIVDLMKVNGKLAKVKVSNNGKLFFLPATAIFSYIGRLPNTDFIQIKINTDKEGYLIVDCYNSTSVPGLFAAGDITCKLKQAITACGDGANAYYFAKKYIQKNS